jgi:alanine-glyoxylate transaminase/serine-glyoxylate transaminase/serine-pyruvate transaminase
LSPVAIGKRGWEIIDRNPNKGQGWYSDLRVWRKFATEWSDRHPFLVTMATNNVMALHASLLDLLDEGIPQRLERYHALAMKLRFALRNLEMPLVTSDELMAPVLTAAYGPVGIATDEIVEYLAEDHGIKISGGLGSLKNKIFRIGHMSPTVAENDIDDVGNALADFKKKRGLN